MGDLMNTVVKEYKLNRDFNLICTTYILDDSHKRYEIIVRPISLPFLFDLETYTTDNPVEANSMFKKLAQKYKEDLSNVIIR